MNPADGLLSAVLEQPREAARWLILSDWLEEQGGPANLARAALLRLEAERLALPDEPDQLLELCERAAALVQECPESIGALRQVLDQWFEELPEDEREIAAPEFVPALLGHWLSLPTVSSALAVFLLADHTSVIAEPLAAGTTWEGELHQRRHRFPTVLSLRERQGNQFSGDMTQDFSSLFGEGMEGTFYFRGAIAAGVHVAFITYRMIDLAAGPGVYQFRLNRLRRLNGTWALGDGRRGKMWLKQNRQA
jgi:uncharacterized protein (TIGR02996 family)